MGRSPIAPRAFNCNAPDTGNMEILAEFGTPEQKKQWLQPLLDGEIRSCFSMTEPEVSGADPTGLRARAVLDEKTGEWVIDGHKWYTSGAVGAAHNLAVRQYGAEGVVSFFNGTGKPIDRPDQMGWSGIQASADPNVRTTWGFILSLRMGLDLLGRLEKHQKVMVHAKVKAAEYDAPMNVVVATIPGDGSTNEEFHFTAHLFEGIAKQGANDNCGGPATQLEAGRAWIEMIKDGTLPRPKRTIRFLWVPEDRKSTRLNSSHMSESRMPSSA